MKARYGVETMPETGENVARDYQVSRLDQDAFAARSQARTAAAQASGFFAEEIVAVQAPDAKGKPSAFEHDEHPRPGRQAMALHRRLRGQDQGRRAVVKPSRIARRHRAVRRE